MEKLKKVPFEAGDTVFIASVEEDCVIEGIVLAIDSWDIRFLDKKDKSEKFAYTSFAHSTLEEATTHLEHYIEEVTKRRKKDNPLLTLFDSWTNTFPQGQTASDITAMKRALQEEYQINIDELLEMQSQKEKEEEDTMKEQPIEESSILEDDLFKGMDLETVNGILKTLDE